MKKQRISSIMPLFGIIVLVSVIAFSMVACNNGSLDDDYIPRSELLILSLYRWVTTGLSSSQLQCRKPRGGSMSGLLLTARLRLSPEPMILM